MSRDTHQESSPELGLGHYTRGRLHSLLLPTGASFANTDDVDTAAALNSIVPVALALVVFNHYRGPPYLPGLDRVVPPRAATI